VFARRQTHIALILDNLSAYKKARLDLTHVSLEYLPPNSTSVIQGLDQGIIWNVKVLYRQGVLRDRLEKLENNQKWEFSLYDACVMLVKAWNDVTEETIVNCFNHAFSFERAKLSHPVFQHLHPSSSQSSNSTVPFLPSLPPSQSSSGLPNLGNSCYLNACLQAIAVCVSEDDVQQLLQKSAISVLNGQVLSVVQQIQTGVRVGHQQLNAVVAAFRRTLDPEEKFKPQDALFAFNAFMQLLSSDSDHGIATLFTQQITMQYLCHGCNQRTPVRSAPQFSLMTSIGIQEQFTVMQEGRFEPEEPRDAKDACVQCGGYAQRTHFELFDWLPKCLTMFRNSIYPLRSAPEAIVVSGGVYSLAAIVFNVNTVHYFCLLRKPSGWFTASDGAVLPITHPTVSEYTSSLKINTIPYGFFYRRNEAEGTLNRINLLPFYSSTYSEDYLSQVRLLVHEDRLIVTTSGSLGEHVQWAGAASTSSKSSSFEPHPRTTKKGKCLCCFHCLYC
jgi:hypothetical protein